MLEIILAIIILVGDQLSKHFAAINCQTPVEFIKGVVRFSYVENRGAAWGMLSGATVFFIIITLIFAAVMVAICIRNHKRMTMLSRITAAMIFAGAVGNLIDRIVFGYVRDMIEVTFINFPVFNIADSAIVIGVILVVIDLLFFKNNLFDVIEADVKGIIAKRKGQQPPKDGNKDE